MSRFPLSAPASPRLVGVCIVTASVGLFAAFAPAQDAAPTPGGKHRNGRAAAAAATPPSAALLPAADDSPAPARPAPPILTNTSLPGQDIDEVNELSPPVDRRTAEEADPVTAQTEILATQGATFASKDRIAVFTGEVRVHDPKFQLACDNLTVFLNKQVDKTEKTAKTASAAATPSGTPPPLAAGSTPPAPAEKQSSGGIDHAIAKGHVIIIQERAATDGAETKRSVGRADWASFDNKSGDMVLKGTPSVEQNGNTHVATSPDTVMTLRRDNSLLTVGPSRTLITQRKGADSGFGPIGPTTSPAPANKPRGNGTTR